MTFRSTPHPTLEEILRRMEGDIATLLGLTVVVRDLGTAGVDVTSSGLFALGGVMVAKAEAVEADWTRCLELSALERRAPPCA